MRRRGTGAEYRPGPWSADTVACDNPRMSVEQPHRPDWLGRLPWPSAFGHREWYRSRTAAGLIAAASVAASTGVVALLTPSVPVRSAGVFYLVAVLAISSIYGLWLGTRDEPRIGRRLQLLLPAAPPHAHHQLVGRLAGARGVRGHRARHEPPGVPRTRGGRGGGPACRRGAAGRAARDADRERVAPAGRPAPARAPGGAGARRARRGHPPGRALPQRSGRPRGADRARRPPARRAAPDRRTPRVGGLARRRADRPRPGGTGRPRPGTRAAARERGRVGGAAPLERAHHRPPADGLARLPLPADRDLDIRRGAPLRPARRRRA